MHYYTWTICVSGCQGNDYWFFGMNESAHNLVNYIVITVEFVITVYEEGFGNGVWCEVLHFLTEKRAVISGQVFKNGDR